MDDEDMYNSGKGSPSLGRQSLIDALEKPSLNPSTCSATPNTGIIPSSTVCAPNHSYGSPRQLIRVPVTGDTVMMGTIMIIAYGISIYTLRMDASNGFPCPLELGARSWFG